MVESLNFKAKEKAKVKAFLKGFEEKETKTQYEEFRCKIGKSIVTLYSTGKVTVQGPDSGKVKDLLLEALRGEGELVLGIDETGRGEKTGPFVIVGVLGNTEDFREFRDSKKVKGLKLEKKSELVKKKAEAVAVFSLNPPEIDELRGNGLTMDGIEAQVINQMAEVFRKKNKGLKVKVDGKRLKGSGKGIEFIIKGDDLEPIIGAASIVAKNTRNQSENRQIRKSWKG
jgi:ribonuclease HII